MKSESVTTSVISQKPASVTAVQSVTSADTKPSISVSLVTKKTQQASKSETKVSAVTSALSALLTAILLPQRLQKDYNSENYYCKNYYHCKDNNRPCYDHNACGDYYQEKDHHR